MAGYQWECSCCKNEYRIAFETIKDIDDETDFDY